MAGFSFEGIELVDTIANNLSRRFGGYFDLPFITVRWVDVVPKAINTGQVLANLALALVVYIVDSNWME